MEGIVLSFLSVKGAEDLVMVIGVRPLGVGATLRWKYRLQIVLEDSYKPFPSAFYVEDNVLA